MAKESTRIRRIRKNDSEIQDKSKLKKGLRTAMKMPKIRKPQAPVWLKTIGKPFAKVLNPVFGPIGRYIKGSWQELRQTKWPNRKSAWILTLAVIVFSVMFAAIILGIDQLFDFIVKNILL